MRAKWILATLMAIALGVMTFVVTGCKKSENEHGQGEHPHQYTCSMHPEVVQDKAGDCPKCGMKLVEKH